MAGAAMILAREHGAHFVNSERFIGVTRAWQPGRAISSNAFLRTAENDVAASTRGGGKAARGILFPTEERWVTPAIRIIVWTYVGKRLRVPHAILPSSSHVRQAYELRFSSPFQQLIYERC